MVVLATAAAVVATQAPISGALSLTRRVIQLGYSPRMNIIHTSSTEIGQIYIPQVNNVLKGRTTRPNSTTFYLGRETLIVGAEHMARWRKKLFILVTRNAQSATAFFGLPPNRVAELGAQVQF